MSQSNDVLKRVLSTQIESWAMMFSDDDELTGDEEPIVETAEMRHVTVVFEGMAVGRLELWVSDALARSLTMNVMGLMDDDISEDNVEDALRELGNLICGHFLTSNFGNQQVFNVGLPHVDTQEFAAEARAGKIKLCVEGDEILGSIQFMGGG